MKRSSATKKTIRISAQFTSITMRSIDGRQRICIGDLMSGFERVQVYRNENGDVLLRPMVEIPASEAWLYKNEKALASVRKGLQDAADGKVSKLDLKKL